MTTSGTRSFDRFRAPWSGLLWSISIFTTVIILGVATAVVSQFPAGGKGAWVLFIVLSSLALLLVSCALFTIRGYRLDESELYVKRLFWETRIPLRSLAKAWASPDAMKGSIRLFGNGGAFSFSGIYRNSRLGRYRVFATDPRRAVVLELGGKSVVVTPGSPQRFLDRLAVLYPDLRIVGSADAR